MRLLLCSLLIVVYCAHTGTRAVETMAPSIEPLFCVASALHALNSSFTLRCSGLFLFFFFCVFRRSLSGALSGDHTTRALRDPRSSPLSSECRELVAELAKR